MIRLYGLEDLRALRDGVAVGVHNLELDSQRPRGRLCRSSLFGLEIVIFGDQRDEKSQFFHVASPPSAPCHSLLLVRIIRRVADYPLEKRNSGYILNSPVPRQYPI